MRKSSNKTVERNTTPRSASGRLYAAIDVGTTKVCTLIARIGPNGELEILSVGIEQSLGMRKALVVDMGGMQEAVRKSWTKATAHLKGQVHGACIGVTGSHIASLHTTGAIASLNGAAEKVVTRQDMQRAVKLSYPKVPEHQELLHVIPLAYSVDTARGVRNPVGLKGRQLSVESHAIIGEAASLENVVRAVEGAGVAVKSMVLEPLASAEAVLTGDEREMGVVLVDIGGGTSDIAIFQHGVMAHTSVIPVAGYQFTNDVAMAFGVPYAVAEQAKLKYGHLIADEVGPNEVVHLSVEKEGERPLQVRRRDLSRFLNDRGVELLRLIRLKVKQAGLEVMPPGGIVFTGGGANLPGWEQLTHEYLPGPVRIAQPRDILGLPAELKSATYSTSIGILLWSIYHPVEQQDYKSHENSNTTYSKGRHWLHLLAQALGTRRAYT